MFVMQPELPVPLLTEFPFPAWATRSDEAGAHPSRPHDQTTDPFEGLS
jgi:hypothetical protein